MGRRNERYAYTFSAQETSDDDDDVKTEKPIERSCRYVPIFVFRRFRV